MDRNDCPFGEGNSRELRLSRAEQLFVGSSCCRRCFVPRCSRLAVCLPCPGDQTLVPGVAFANLGAHAMESGVGDRLAPILIVGASPRPRFYGAREAG